MYLRQRLHSLINAGRGLLWLLRNEPHFRIHVLSVATVCCLATVTGVSRAEWIILILIMTLVICLEALNTALEKLADALHPDRHPLVGIAKDAAAAGVLVSAVSSVIIGALIFIPHWGG